MDRHAPAVAGFCLVASLLLSGCIAPSKEANSSSYGLTVTRIKGAARFQTGTNLVWCSLMRGGNLPSATTIQTAADSFADVVLGEGRLWKGRCRWSDEQIFHRGDFPVIRINSDSVVRLTRISGRLKSNQCDEIDLKSGSILCLLNQSHRRGGLMIYVTNGAIQATEGALKASADGGVALLTGSTTIQFNDAREFLELRPGWQVDIRTGEVTPITDCGHNIKIHQPRDVWVYRPSK